MKKKKGFGTFMLGVLAGAVLVAGCGTAAVAAAGGVSFGNVGLTINGRTAIEAGEVITNNNGCEIPSAITYTDAKGGGNTYVPIRTFSELLNIPVSWEQGMVYLGYTPSELACDISDIIVSDGSHDADGLPLHRAGSKAGPYTEVEPYWPSEDEINQVLTNRPVKSSETFLDSGNWTPVKDEGYFSLSITNTTGRDLVLSVRSPATITTDRFPETVVPAGETVVRTFHVDANTSGMSQRPFAFSLRGVPLTVDGDSALSATVWLVSFTRK